MYYIQMKSTPHKTILTQTTKSHQNDTGPEHDQNDQTQLQEGVNQSHVENEV